MRAGRIGLAQNRLPVSTLIEDVSPEQVVNIASGADPRYAEIGRRALADGSVAIVSLAGGAGSRWTKGAGVVKALNPFWKVAGRHRNFIELHIAKNRRLNRMLGAQVPHVITTSYLTHDAIETALRCNGNYGFDGTLLLSRGRAVGLRFVPMARDLRFAWDELPQQLLDVQAQKVRDSVHAALISWAQSMGEGCDYTDNLPLQCIHPAGHWFEIPNMFRNGILKALLERHPNVRYLMVHNIDTAGVGLDPAILGGHIARGAAMTVEVMSRRIDDRGGSLALVNGKTRLVEGLALPNETVEFGLSYYNTNTFWIDLGRLLEIFELSVPDLVDEAKVMTHVRVLAHRMPTYVTLKDVKKRWGKGQEDIYPVAQFEKLWGDMTALPELECGYVVVPRVRGQQLKEPAQLDGWVRDGSAEYVESLCAF